MSGRHHRRWWDRRNATTALLVAAGLIGVPSLVCAIVGTARDAGDSITASAASAVSTVDDDYPTARGGPISPVGPLALPTIVPTDAPVWEPAKGRVIVDGRPLPAPVVLAPAAAPAPEVAPAAAPDPQTEEPIAAGEETPALIGVPDIPPPAEQEPAPQPEPDPIVPVIPDEQTPPTDVDPAAEPTP